MTYLAKNPVEPNTVAVIPLTCRTNENDKCRTLFQLMGRSLHKQEDTADVDVSQIHEHSKDTMLVLRTPRVPVIHVCALRLTEERPPGPALRPLFSKVMPAVSSVAYPL